MLLQMQLQMLAQSLSLIEVEAASTYQFFSLFESYYLGIPCDFSIFSERIYQIQIQVDPVASLLHLLQGR